MTDTGTAIAFSEEQAMLMDTAQAYCRDKAPMEEVRRLIEVEQGHEDAVWQEMAELGWLGITLPEEYGGSGLGLADVVPIAEAMGRHLFHTPFLSTTLAAQVLLHGGTEEQKRKWLPEIAGGMAATCAFVEAEGDWDLHNVRCRADGKDGALTLSGGKRLTLDAAASGLIIASVDHFGKTALALIDPSTLPANAIEREVVLDETRRSFRVDLTGVTITDDDLLDPAKTDAALARYHLAACLLNAAESCGGTMGALNLIVEYLNTRRQFDRFIGSYQALKHPTVDILVGHEAARSLLYHAATVFEDEGGETAVRMAKAKASEVFAFAGDRAIQFHGAFGFTYDCDAQLYLRRALMNQASHGDAVYHRRKLEGLLFGES